jgi:tetratricopeptide (TPR) repeat protein
VILLFAFLWVAPTAAQLPSTAAIDALYFSRDKPGSLAKSIEDLEFRLKDNPREFDSLWRLSRSLVRRGERLDRKKDKIAAFARAEKLAAEAASIREDRAEAHYWHGIALGRHGQTRGIMRSVFMIGPIKERMARVLALDGRHSGAYHVLGEMYRQLPGFLGGSKSLAVANLEKALEYGPDHTAHYPALAEAYLDADRLEDAVRVLEAVAAVARPADPAEAAAHRADAREILKRLKDSTRK